MPKALILTWVWACCAAAGGARPVWVDAAAPGGGDGTERHPYRTLGEACRGRGPVRIRLAAGSYEGPVELPAGSALAGAPGAVISAPDGAEAIVARGPVALERVAIRGGAVGLAARDRATLSGVELEGQTAAAIRASARVSVEGGRFVATGPGAVGIQMAGAGGDLEVSGALFQGPFARAIDLAGGRARIRRARFSGTTGGIHAEGARLRIEAAELEGRAGPAIFVAGGDAELADVSVRGHEYALQTANARVSIDGFSSVASERAALGLVGGLTDARRVSTFASGPLGAVQVTGGSVRLRGFFIRAPSAQALFARDADVRLSLGAIVGVTSPGEGEGNAIHVRSGTADIEAVAVDGAGGSCVLAADEARVRAHGLWLEGCRWGALVADTGAELGASGVRISSPEEAALVAINGGTLLGAGIHVARGAAALEADCAGASSIRVWNLGGARAPLPPCALAR